MLGTDAAIQTAKHWFLGAGFGIWANRISEVPAVRDGPPYPLRFALNGGFKSDKLLVASFHRLGRELQKSNRIRRRITPSTSGPSGRQYLRAIWHTLVAAHVTKAMRHRK
jgi:hypothetical protein